MPPSSFIATGWNNDRWSPTGAGYGLRIPIEDRDKYFERDWSTVSLRLVGERTSRTAEANVDKASFWSDDCRELVKIDIGQWFIENGYARWSRDTPPRFWMLSVADRDFEVRPEHT